MTSEQEAEVRRCDSCGDELKGGDGRVVPGRHLRCEAARKEERATIVQELLVTASEVAEGDCGMTAAEWLYSEADRIGGLPHSSDRQANESAGAGRGVSRNASHRSLPEAPRSDTPVAGKCCDHYPCDHTGCDCDGTFHNPGPGCPRQDTGKAAPVAGPCRDCGHNVAVHGYLRCDAQDCRCLAYVEGTVGG